MTTDAVIDVLRFANGNDRTVRLMLRDGTEVVGLPGTLDTHPAAFEVFLHPAGDDDTEIGIALSGITSAELL